MNPRFLKAIVILPGAVLVYVPAALLWLFQDTAYAARFPPDSLFLWLIAVALGSQGLIPTLVDYDSSDRVFALFG